MQIRFRTKDFPSAPQGLVAAKELGIPCVSTVTVAGPGVIEVHLIGLMLDSTVGYDHLSGRCPFFFLDMYNYNVFCVFPHFVHLFLQIIPNGRCIRVQVPRFVLISTYPQRFTPPSIYQKDSNTYITACAPVGPARFFWKFRSFQRSQARHEQMTFG